MVCKLVRLNKLYVGNLTKKFENTKGVIRSRNSVRRRPGNTMDKEKNNARQNNKQKTIE